MQDWKEYVMEARSQEPPVPWSEIGRELEEVFPDLTYEQCKQKGRDFYRQQPEYKGKRLGGPKKPEKPKGVKVAQNFEPADFYAKAKKSVTFGIVSDTHMCSRWAQISHLHSFYETCAERGIKAVYHAGDISDGVTMRPGHENELYVVGVDAQVEEICRIYPKVDGITTYFITGNHDGSAMKKCGLDIGKIVGNSREDLVYLGRDIANIHLADACVMQLAHPWSGSSYALSYRPQKMIDAMPIDDRPDILIVGHMHKSMYIEYGGIECLHAGSFQGYTPFMQGKGLHNSIGGWIVTVEFNSDGSIKRFVPEWFPFKEIKNDYKSWR